jgi:hypothetical protein
MMRGVLRPCFHSFFCGSHRRFPNPNFIEVIMLAQDECVIGVFASPAAAEEAVRTLEGHGWREDQISLITRGHEAELDAVSGLRHSDHTEKSAAIGGAAGATVGLLAGSSLFLVPGLGPVLFAGAMASGLTGGLVGGLLGAMSGWGVKGDHVRQYEAALKENKAIVVLTGEPATLAEGRAELLASSAERVVLHAENADSDRVDA